MPLRLCASISQKPDARTSSNFHCMLLAPVTRSFSGDVEISYIFPFIKCDVIFGHNLCVNGHAQATQKTLILIATRQAAAQIRHDSRPQIWRIVKIIHQLEAPEVKSDMCHCLVSKLRNNLININKFDASAIKTPMTHSKLMAKTSKQTSPPSRRKIHAYAEYMFYMLIT